MGRLKDAWNVLRGGSQDRAKGAIVEPYINDETGKLEWKAGSSFIGGAMAGRRGDREVLASITTNPILHSVLHRIATAYAAVTPRLYAHRSKRTGKFVKTTAAQVAGFDERQKFLQDLDRLGELVEVERHPLLDLLANPCPELTAQEAEYYSIIQFLAVGEFLHVFEMNGLATPVQYRPFGKTMFTPETHSGLQFRINLANQSWVVPAEQAMWVRHIDPRNPYGRGSGTGVALADESHADEGAAKRIKNYFEQNALPESVISFESAGKPALDAAKLEWEARFKGAKNAFKNLWTGAKINVQRLDTSFKEMTLVDLRRFSRDTHGQVYGVPPELRGILEASNRATIEAAEVIFGRWVLVPLLEVVRSARQARLVPLFDERLILSYESPIPDDREFKAKVYAASPGAFKLDEHRALAGDPPLGDERGEELMAPPPVPTFGSEPPALAADPPWVKQLAAGLRRKDLKLTDIDAVLEALRPARLTERVTPSMEDGLRSWGQQALSQIGSTLSFDMQNPLVRQLMDESGKRIVGVTDTTRDQLRATMRAGVEAGEGIDAIARRVRETFDLADSSRSRTIARTEVLGTANGGNFVAWKMSGVVASKRWIHNQSADPRPAHQALDGVEVGIDGRWSANGHTAPHPGGFGVAEEDINCRCGMRPVVGDPKAAKDAMSADERAAFFAAFDKAADGWERDVQRALRAGFDDQRLDILAALNRIAG